MPPKTSKQEKCDIIYGMLQDSRTVWTMKDIEKGAKGKMPDNTVADTVKALMDDDLVQMDKIGSANYYWSLPSARHGQLQHKNTLLTAELESLTASVAQTRAAVAAASAARPEDGERLATEAALASAKERNQTLKAELASHSASDQALQKQMVGLQSMGIDAANRWTDNLHLIGSFLRNDKGLERAQVSQFMSQAGINVDELDYVTRASVQESLKPKPAKVKGGKKRTADDDY